MILGTKEYECAKEIADRLKKIGEKEISLTKVSILLYILYRDDIIGPNCFEFDTVFYKNIYGIPCNERVVSYFEADKLYNKSKIVVYYSWLEAQEKAFDDLIINYGTLSPAELYTMVQYDMFLSNTEINQNIIIVKDMVKKAPETSFLKKLILNRKRKTTN